MTSFFRIKGAFFSTTKRICAKFFSGSRRKHLFITTCIEKQCTWPLSYQKEKRLIRLANALFD